MLFMVVCVEGVMELCNVVIEFEIMDLIVVL